MHPGRIAVLSSVLVAGFVSGCGGGDSSSTMTPPADGSYAGTYGCANTSLGDANFTAVLPTAGAFSSCSGDVDKHTAQISCTGSITAEGTFNVSGIDTNGVKSTYVGVADATTVTGTLRQCSRPPHLFQAASPARIDHMQHLRSTSAATRYYAVIETIFANAAKDPAALARSSVSLQRPPARRPN